MTTYRLDASPWAREAMTPEQLVELRALSGGVRRADAVLRVGRRPGREYYAQVQFHKPGRPPHYAEGDDPYQLAREVLARAEATA